MRFVQVLSYTCDRVRTVCKLRAELPCLLGWYMKCTAASCRLGGTQWECQKQARIVSQLRRAVTARDVHAGRSC
jgi:hypothetical protein